MTERTYYSVYFRADSSARLYRRSTYSLLEYLGDLGGLIDIIFILGSLIIAALIERQFNAALVGETYQI